MKQAFVSAIIAIWVSSVIRVCAGERDPFGKSIQIDPFSFAYYKDRSADSIASEIEANGFKAVRLIIHCVPGSYQTIAELVNAFHQRGIAVWYETFGNGAYNLSCFPPGWEEWRMKLKGKDPNQVAPGFVYLCINNPAYREWKKQQVTSILRNVRFDGIEIMEAFFPAVNGPSNENYGCLCENCVEAFLRMYPEEKAPPDFNDDSSPYYYVRNKRLYQKWINFRCASVASFQDFIINSAGGVRDTCPGIKVGAWGIADNVPDPVNTLREWQGSDGYLIVKTVRPDVYVLQTDWPDWSNPSLAPNYPLLYKPYVEAIRKVSGVPIILQTDLGSKQNCRRGLSWLNECEAAAKKAGMAGVTGYEYHLNVDIYKAEPRPASATCEDKTVRIIFNKRLDEKSATDIRNYSISSGSIHSAKLDGNIVELKVSDKPHEVIIKDLSDDPTRRYFRDFPRVTMSSPQAIQVK